MYEVKRIGVLSAIKIVAAMYAVIGLIIGGLYACLGLTIFASTFAAELDEFGLGGGVTMIFVAICMPFLYARNLHRGHCRSHRGVDLQCLRRPGGRDRV
jgi:small neutral amino acid transporter SnatA (MarC family)